MTDEQKEAITAGQQSNEGAGATTSDDNAAKGGNAGQTATTSTGETPEQKTARLETELAQARLLQGQADRKAKREAQARKRLEARFRGNANTSSSNESEDDTSSSDNDEVGKARMESEILRTVYSNADYRKVLDADPTLKKIIESNPLALIKNPLDAEDAAMQIQNLLDERVDELPEPSKPKAEVKAQPEAKKEIAQENQSGFGAEAVNPQAAPSKGYADKMKQGDFDGAVTDKINDPTAWNK